MDPAGKNRREIQKQTNYNLKTQQRSSTLTPHTICQSSMSNTLVFCPAPIVAWKMQVWLAEAILGVFWSDIRCWRDSHPADRMRAAYTLSRDT